MEHIRDKEAYPESLASLGVETEFASGALSGLELTDDGLVLTLRSDHMPIDGQTIVYSAYRTDDGTIHWDCTGGSLAPKYRPAACRPGR